MEEAAKKNGKVLQIGFVRRYGMDAHAAKLYRTAARPAISILPTFRICAARCCPAAGSATSATRAAALIDLGVHVMDLARYLAGRPKPVAAYGVTFRNISATDDDGTPKAWTIDTSGGEFERNVEDFAAGFIRFDNGFVMHVSASFTLNIKRTTATSRYSAPRRALSSAPPQCYTSDGKNGVLDDEKYNKPSGFNDIFDYRVAHFIDCVKNGTLYRSRRDGVALMRMIDAIYESARTR